MKLLLIFYGVIIGILSVDVYASDVEDDEIIAPVGGEGSLFCRYHNYRNREYCGTDGRSGASFCYGDVQNRPYCFANHQCDGMGAFTSCAGGTGTYSCPYGTACGDICGNGFQCYPLCGYAAYYSSGDDEYYDDQSSSKECLHSPDDDMYDDEWKLPNDDAVDGTFDDDTGGAELSACDNDSACEGDEVCQNGRCCHVDSSSGTCVTCVAVGVIVGCVVLIGLFYVCVQRKLWTLFVTVKKEEPVITLTHIPPTTDTQHYAGYSHSSKAHRMAPPVTSIDNTGYAIATLLNQHPSPSALAATIADVNIPTQHIPLTATVVSVTNLSSTASNITTNENDNIPMSTLV